MTCEEILEKVKYTDGPDNQAFKHGRTLLHYACKQGCEEAVKCLLDKPDKKEDVYVRDEFGCLPSFYAAAYGHYDVFKILLDEDKMNINDKLDELVASYYGNQEFLRSLLDHEKGKELKINLSNSYGHIALHFAARRGNLKIVQLLIDRGTDVNAQDIDGRTPLHWACLYDRVDIVRLLIIHGADVNMKNRNGKTPLDLLREDLRPQMRALAAECERERRLAQAGDAEPEWELCDRQER